MTVLTPPWRCPCSSPRLGAAFCPFLLPFLLSAADHIEGMTANVKGDQKRPRKAHTRALQFSKKQVFADRPSVDALCSSASRRCRRCPSTQEGRSPLRRHHHPRSPHPEPPSASSLQGGRQAESVFPSALGHDDPGLSPGRLLLPARAARAARAAQAARHRAGPLDRREVARREVDRLPRRRV